ncbi:MAG: beta-N-acetylhexosaminidase [Bacteroidaceae bacterium]|nr:beta-N-acetylhexosaminidase [Bacteroidaceae bacterium]
MFRKTATLLLAVIAFATTAFAQNNNVANLLPKPSSVVMGNQNSVFHLTNKTRIVYDWNKNDASYAIKELDRLTTEVFGKKLKKNTKVHGDNNIIFKHNGSLAEEQYILEITPENILIYSNGRAGAFYAVQTLRQILPVQAYETPIDLEKVALPTLKITDKPHFAYRGFMLDCSRHFWDVKTVKKVIDIMALHKMNRFHWHLTEDQGWRIEIKKYPLLTKMGSRREQTTTGRNEGMDGIPYGGYYSQSDIREVVKYAQERCITIIPEIEIPGHSLGALCAYPWLGCQGEKGNYKTWANWGVSPQIACAGKESSFKFWEDVLGEVMDLFPSEYIHIGGDEAPRDEWKACPLCQQRIKDNGLKNEAELQSYVNGRIEKILNDKGRKLIGWDEILEGGVSENATIMSWRGASGGIAAAKKGNYAIMTPDSHCYLNFYQTTDRPDELLCIGGYIPLRKAYSLDPYDKLAKEEQKYILGVQANLWTEYISTPLQLEYMLLPRLGAIAEIGWSNPAPDKKDTEEFIGRAKELSRYYCAFGWNFGRHFYEDGVQIGW